MRGSLCEKQVLAWWTCEHTTASRRWVAERLGMGHDSRSGQALYWVKCAASRAAKAMKAKLSQHLQ